MRTAFVTGGNRGIGLALCKRLIKLGYKVYMGTRQLENGSKAIESLGCPTNCVPVVIDVEHESSIHAAYQEYLSLKTEEERLNLFINNAGANLDWIPDEFCPGILDIPGETFIRSYKIHTLAPILATKYFLPSLASGARIINVASGAAALSTESDQQAAYAASKIASLMVTRKLAAALKEKGIVVNSACPGWCKTEMGGVSAPDSTDAGADSILAACFLDSDHPPSGGFFRNGARVYIDNLVSPSDVDPLTANLIEKLVRALEIDKYSRVALYGSGNVCFSILSLLPQHQRQGIVGIIDKNPSKHGMPFLGYTIHSLEEIPEINPDAILLTLARPESASKEIQAIRNSAGLGFKIILPDSTTVES